MRSIVQTGTAIVAAFIAASNGSFAAAAVESDATAKAGLKHYGYIDKTGQFVIKPIYDFTGPFSEDCAVVKCGNELQVIDKTGKVMFKRDTGGVFASIPSPFKEGLSVTNNGNLSGYADKSGKMVIEAKYAMARDFCGGLAAVASLDPQNEWAPMRWSYIDKTGKTVIAGPFQMAMTFSQDLAAVQVDGKWGFIDRTGKLVIPAKYLTAGSFSDNLAVVQDEDSQFHYIDRTGAKAFDGSFTIATVFSEGIASYGKVLGKLNGIVDEHGKTTELRETLGVEPVGECSSGMIPIRCTAGYGFVNKKGDLVISPKYSGSLGYTDGLSGVEENGKWGFIDPSDKMVIKPQFSEVKSFSEGLASAAP